MGRHALRRLSPVDLLAAVCARVSEGTGLACVTDPADEPSPFYSATLAGIRPGRSKSMFLDVFEVQLHAVAAPSRTQAEVLAMVGDLSSAMCQDVVLPEPFALVRQDDMGLQAVKRDPTGEWHAIATYELTVSYGLMIK